MRDTRVGWWCARDRGHGGGARGGEEEEDPFRCAIKVTIANVRAASPRARVVGCGDDADGRMPRPSGLCVSCTARARPRAPPCPAAARARTAVRRPSSRRRRHRARATHKGAARQSGWACTRGAVRARGARGAQRTCSAPLPPKRAASQREGTGRRYRARGLRSAVRTVQYSCGALCCRPGRALGCVTYGGRPTRPLWISVTFF